MELRKDPITRTWVITGDNEVAESDGNPCPYCFDQPHAGAATPASKNVPAPILSVPLNGAQGGIRVYPHPFPMYRIDVAAERRGDGIYDIMRNLGAHEVMIESPDHYHELSLAPDAE